MTSRFNRIELRPQKRPFTKPSINPRPPTEPGQATQRGWTVSNEDSTTTFTQEFPTKLIGDVAIWWVTSINTVTHTTPTGWTLAESGTEPGILVSIYYRVIDGTEGSTATLEKSDINDSYGFMVVLGGGGLDYSTHVPTSELHTGSSSLDPPQVTPATVPAAYRVYAVLCYQNSEITGVPSGYTLINGPLSGIKSTGMDIYAAYKDVAITTAEDPGPFTHTNSSGFDGLPSTVAVLFESTDDPDLAAGDHTHVEADVTDLSHTTTVAKAGTLIGTRGRINFIEGTDVTLTIADDAANDEVDVTINSSGGGGGSATLDRWDRRKFARVDGTSAHADDDEFSTDTSADYTLVEDTSPNLTWSVTDGALRLENPGGDATAEFHAVLKPLTPTTAPVTIEAMFTHNSVNSASMAGIVFADGTTYGSGSQISFTHRINGTSTLLRTQRHTGFNSQSLATEVGLISQRVVLVRLVWVSSNTFRWLYSTDGYHWDGMGLADTAFTLTPTHFGFWISSWGGTALSLATCHYLRIYESALDEGAE